MARFGKLGFGESCDSEVLQRRTVQIRQKSLRTSFKLRCGWSGRGRKIDPRSYWSVLLTGERQSSRAHQCKYPVSTQCGKLKCYKSPGKVSAMISEGSNNERGK